MIFSLVLQKLKAFRMSVPSLILLALASYRTLTTGDSIVLVGICASVVPFICQFRHFPQAPETASPFQNVLSNYILNLILMVLYLAYILLLTFIGKQWIPTYVENPYFMDLLLLAVCANVVFISALIPICQDLTPFQRLLPGIILCNAQLVFMMMAKGYVQTAAPGSLNGIAAGFIALIVVLALNFMMICYRERKPKQAKAAG